MRSELELIISGPFGWESKKVRAMLNQSGPRVRYLGYVPEPDLPPLVAGANALVYPSFYEGFGLPVAQAMAAGTPVITSNRSCLPEIVAGGGLLIDPNSVDDLSDAIERLHMSSTLGAELSKQARVRARSFRWSDSAVESLKFFHEMHAGPHSRQGSWGVTCGGTN
jgi:alpha-1,3-rhamnosyl/mannosyltransferase